MGNRDRGVFDTKEYQEIGVSEPVQYGRHSNIAPGYVNIVGWLQPRIYVRDGENPRAYHDLSVSDAVTRNWDASGIGEHVDRQDSFDLSKGYLCAVPHVVDVNDGTGHRSQAVREFVELDGSKSDDRSADELSRRFGKRLLEFERDCGSLRDLFDVYAKAHDAYENAQALEGISRAVQASRSVAQRRVNDAQKRYLDTLKGVLKYCEEAYSANHDVMTKIDAFVSGSEPAVGMVIPDQRDYEEVARTFTFGSDEEIAELRRSVELCSMWAGGNSLRDVAAGAALVASTYPERRSDMADLICEAVHRDMDRVMACIKPVANEDCHKYFCLTDMAYIGVDLRDWADDGLAALDCAWLMEPEKMPCVQDYDALIKVYKLAQEVVDVFEDKPERELPSGTNRVKEKTIRCAQSFSKANEWLASRVETDRDFVEPLSIPSRIQLSSPAPAHRIANLAKSMKSSDVAQTFKFGDNIGVFGYRCAMWGDVEATRATLDAVGVEGSDNLFMKKAMEMQPKASGKSPIQSGANISDKEVVSDGLDR